jgi:cytochrome c
MVLRARVAVLMHVNCRGRTGPGLIHVNRALTYRVEMGAGIGKISLVQRTTKRGGVAMRRHLAAALGACLLGGVVSAGAQPAVDVSAAEALTKKSGCMKCHSVTAKKDGPAFKVTAEKYKGKADAEEKLYTHLTTNPKIKVDGKEELHETLKTKDDAEIKNVIRYVLSR